MGDSQTPKSETAEREEAILAFWKEHRIFEKTLEQEAPEGEFIFYDGPPFATGLPHMGHLLGSSIKDVAGRYKTMRGYRVPRRWGWDCHGLPIENIVEKKLNLASKKDILLLGVETFNEEAKKTVLAFADDWKRYIERLGRWVDFDHSYKTMDQSYMEAVWWALKRLHEDGRLYEGKKVLMYCSHCETPLAKAEIAMDNSYREVSDEAAVVKFRLTDDTVARNRLGVPMDAQPIYVLAWTTTPWTLPGNMALAVGKEITYELVRLGDEYHLVARDRLDVLTGAYEVIGEIPGRALVGLSYEPLYDIPYAREIANEKTWTVQAGDFVTTEEGSGVVHIAPMYGEDDYELGKELGLPMIQILDASGHYHEHAPELVRGQFYKKGGKAIVADLATRGLLFSQGPYTHSYPHCYRCGTALIYNALPSWFIAIRDVRKKMLEENEHIAWYPEHLKHGRFYNTVEHAPDWNISRNRFWASPLPIWRSADGANTRVIGSVDELKAYTKKSGNTYLAVRHGESTYFAEGIYTIDPEGKYGLTEQGAKDVGALAAQVPQEKPIRIFYSPVRRTKESAEILARELQVSDERMHPEPRLREIGFGVCEGEPQACFRSVMERAGDEWYTAKAEGGESNDDVRMRVAELLYELEARYTNETILLVTHEAGVQALAIAADGLSNSFAATRKQETDVPPGSLREIPFVPLPHNARFELDLHRPYIDRVSLVAEDGTALARVEEVVDCWVESGSMPFAADHVLGGLLEKPKKYPGDFIAEYIAQTRTWFYYMHAMGILLFGGRSFTHCVTTGTVLAEDGSKMSKSKGNFTDPLVNIDRFGADALRLYLLGSVVMQAEDMSFRDEELKEIHNKVIGIFWNTFAFYELCAELARNVSGSSPEQMQAHTHPLDRWVLARLAQVISEGTACMERFDTVHMVRLMRDFINDLSTWYVRRSRERMKGALGEEARLAALTVFREVLRETAKLLAPIAPFIAEQVYRGCDGGEESVHLDRWPQAGIVDEEILARMAHTRAIASEALELRAKAGIKIRQPLATLTVPEGSLLYEDILKEELNVKAVRFGATLALDTALTSELLEEGDVRELVRAIQDLRKRAGLNLGDTIMLGIETDDRGRALIEKNRISCTAATGIADIMFAAQPEGEMVKGESWNLMRIAIV